jgi:hypothetical protein
MSQDLDRPAVAVESLPGSVDDHSSVAATKAFRKELPNEMDRNS